MYVSIYQKSFKLVVWGLTQPSSNFLDEALEVVDHIFWIWAADGAVLAHNSLRGSARVGDLNTSGYST